MVQPKVYFLFHVSTISSRSELLSSLPEKLTAISFSRGSIAIFMRYERLVPFKELHRQVCNLSAPF